MSGAGPSSNNSVWIIPLELNFNLREKWRPRPGGVAGAKSLSSRQSNYS
jgi:hypothetical protein